MIFSIAGKLRKVKMRSKPLLIVKAFQRPERVLKKLQRYIQHGVADGIRLINSGESLEIINQKEIRFVGLRRTGNHAVINWIAQQEPGKVQHLNNLIPAENPFRYKYEHLRDYYPDHGKQAERYRQEAIGNFVKKDCLIYSYEDFSLPQIASKSFERKHDIYLGKTGKRYDILLLRDPFNLIASRLKSEMMGVRAKSQNVVELWIDYAKEFLGETNYLKLNKVCVNYNRWAGDQDYRREIAEQLELEFSDRGLYEVRKLGGGSSFDGVKFDGDARKMDVLNRWKKFKDDPAYRQLVNNGELIAYSEKIFGHLPGTEELRKN